MWLQYIYSNTVYKLERIHSSFWRRSQREWVNWNGGLSKNKLSFNLSKTKIMLFGNCKISTHVQVMIANVNIERVNDTLLGVILDHRICYKPYIKICVRSIAILGKNKPHSGSQSIIHCVLFTCIKLVWITVWRCGITRTKATHTHYAC